MAPNNFDEEALRKKIREQLAQQHKERQQQQQSSGDDSASAPRLPEEDESFYLETYVRRKLEAEVYSRHPEFVKCGNHLGQIKWLTPLEMEEEYEFYPFEEGFFSRMRQKLFPVRVKLPKDPEIQKLIADFREEIEKDAQERIARYRENLEQSKQNLQSETERRIFEEEQDRFYSKQRGYHKYRNHIGETRWMTHEEFDSQEEFVERVYTPLEKWSRRAALVLAIALLGFGGWYLYGLFGPDHPRGFLIVDVEGARGNLYIDQKLAVGFTPGQPYPVDEGQHRISVLRSGYESEPGFEDISVDAGDTLSARFRLKPMAGDKATVSVKAPYPDAGIYVNGEFKGTIRENRYLNLPPGDHSISLEKAGYISVPPVRALILTAGDTVETTFRMNARRSSTAEVSSATRVGLIDVNSNVRGADIFMNGENTGFKTDYVLQKLPFGQYVIRVEKEGFDIYPREQVVRLDNDSRQARADFTLTSLTRPVTISTNPVQGTILVDGKDVGRGRFSGSLGLGTHTISFGDVEDYITPPPQEIEVTESGSTIFNFTYGSKLFVEVTPRSTAPDDAAAVTIRGHILTGTTFKSSQENGPELLDDRSAWKIGYAFQYQNPPGSDALMIRFRAPQDLTLTNRVELKLEIYGTNENYPLVLGGKTRYRVILNNTVIADQKEPRYSVKEAAAGRYETYTITNNLKPGYNTLIIAAAQGNSAFMELHKIVIE